MLLNLSFLLLILLQSSLLKLFSPLPLSEVRSKFEFPHRQPCKQISTCFLNVTTIIFISCLIFIVGRRSSSLNIFEQHHLHPPVPTKYIAI